RLRPTVVVVVVALQDVVNHLNRRVGFAGIIELKFLKLLRCWRFIEKRDQLRLQLRVKEKVYKFQRKRDVFGITAFKVLPDQIDVSWIINQRQQHKYLLVVVADFFVKRFSEEFEFRRVRKFMNRGEIPDGLAHLGIEDVDNV